MKIGAIVNRYVVIAPFLFIAPPLLAASGGTVKLKEVVDDPFFMQYIEKKKGCEGFDNDNSGLGEGVVPVKWLKEYNDARKARKDPVLFACEPSKIHDKAVSETKVSDLFTPSVYLGVGLGVMSGNIGGQGISDIAFLSLRPGISLGKYLSLEYQFGQGVTNSDGIKLKEINSFNLLPSFPLTDSLRVYARIGYGQVSLGSSNGGKMNTGQNWGFGGGVEYALSKSISMAASYYSVADVKVEGEAVKTSGADLTVRFRF